MTAYFTALRTMPALRAPLALSAGLCLYLFYPPVRANPGLHFSFLGVGLFLAIWHVLIARQAVRRGTRLAFDVVIRRPHWVQPLAQGSIYLYWGWYARDVYAYAPFIAAQLLFLYAFDMLLAWSRRDRYQLGFGPFPIIFSTNLFLWFRPDWFYFQFALVAAGSLGKEFIRWNRDGRRTHIFNPSAFSLSLASVLLLATGGTSLTYGVDIAATQQSPPHMYEWLFLVGFVGGTLFRVTTMTMSAAITLVLIGAAYTVATGSYYFIDTSIPAAVFLGMTLLFTDPSTSPRTDLGRVIFGTLYGASVFVLYVVLDRMGLPTFYDKLLAVPALNLSVQAIDRFVSARGRWADFGLPFSPARRNLVYLACWVPIFAVMLATHAVGKEHEGRLPEFWAKACEENRPRACKSLLAVHEDLCLDRHATSCNEAGILLTEGRVVAADLTAAVDYFNRACGMDLLRGCVNADVAREGNRNVSREMATLADLFQRSKGPKASPPAAPPATSGRAAALDAACASQDALACTELGLIYLQGTEGAVDYVRAAVILEKGCLGGQGVACANLGLMHRRGAGMPPNEPKARELLGRACRQGVAEACRVENSPP